MINHFILWIPHELSVYYVCNYLCVHCLCYFVTFNCVYYELICVSIAMPVLLCT